VLCRYPILKVKRLLKSQEKVVKICGEISGVVMCSTVWQGDLCCVGTLFVGHKLVEIPGESC
jgi:hypothetical protein